MSAPDGDLLHFPNLSLERAVALTISRQPQLNDAAELLMHSSLTGTLNMLAQVMGDGYDVSYLLGLVTGYALAKEEEHQS